MWLWFLSDVIFSSFPSRIFPLDSDLYKSLHNFFTNLPIYYFYFYITSHHNITKIFEVIWYLYHKEKCSDNHFHVMWCDNHNNTSLDWTKWDLFKNLRWCIRGWLSCQLIKCDGIRRTKDVYLEVKYFQVG